MDKFTTDLLELVLYFACKADNKDMQPTEEGVKETLDELMRRELNDYPISEPDQRDLIKKVDKRLYQDYQDWKMR